MVRQTRTCPGTALSFADGASVAFQTGAATSDLVNLTGANSTVSFGGA